MEPKLEFAFTVTIRLKPPAVYLRPSLSGAERAAIYLRDGTFEGPNIRGRVLPDSGGDWPVVRADGVIDFDARYMLEEEDGTLIYVQNRGYRWGTPEVMERMRQQQPVDPSEYYMRVAPKFEVAKGKHDWLARYVFIGVAEKTPAGNCIAYYKVL
jgi:hypothetical protein